MLVYRVEHAEDGWGPFFRNRSDRTVQDTEAYQGWRNYYIGDGHPALHVDYTELPIEMDEWFCACPTENMVWWWWFGPIMKLLHEHNFVLRVYTAPDYTVGDSGKQVIFKRKTAVLLEQRALA